MIGALGQTVDVLRVVGTDVRTGVQNILNRVGRQTSKVERRRRRIGLIFIIVHLAAACTGATDVRVQTDRLHRRLDIDFEDQRMCRPFLFHLFGTKKLRKNMKMTSPRLMDGGKAPPATAG